MHEPEIEYLIRSLGIGATYRGYAYLIYGTRLCLSDENYLLFVSKYLYPDIARHYNTTSYSVERNIRTVIKVCWEHGNKSLLEKIALRPLHLKPTSSEFFDIITAHLRKTAISASDFVPVQILFLYASFLLKIFSNSFMLLTYFRHIFHLY